MENYHIVKKGSEWIMKKEGSQRIIYKTNTKKEILKLAIPYAKSKGNVSLKIHKENGQFQEERTYPKGNDPYPPRG